MSDIPTPTPEPASAPAASPPAAPDAQPPTTEPTAAPASTTKVLTRQERLDAANQKYMDWARTATTDDPPDELFAEFARTEADFRAMAPAAPVAPASATSDAPSAASSA